MKKFEKIDFIKDEFKEDFIPDGIENKISKANVDLSKIYKMPEFIIKIKTGVTWTNIGSLGNFSCITGRQKSRKSFVRFFFEAAALSNTMLYNKFYVRLPEQNKSVVYIDTEQSKNNVNFAAQRIIKMSNYSGESYYVYSLRENTYMERCEMIEKIIKKTSNLGILFLDGIADLAYGNNDENEASRVTQLLMTWSSIYNIHIMTIIHQPRTHEGATGHLGSSIEKKAESVISVKKDGNYSVIESKMLRNSSDFAPFPFEINEDYIPVLIDNNEVQETINYDEPIPF